MNKFFASGMYQTVMMSHDSMIVPWPEKIDELKFSCHTSLITPKIIVQELDKKNLIPKNLKEVFGKSIEYVSDLLVGKSDET